MARQDSAPSFEKRLLCSELDTRGSILVEGRWSRITMVKRVYRKVARPGHAKPLTIHVETQIFTDHPDYGNWEPSKTRQPGCKISVRFWLTAQVWEDRKR